MARIGPSPVAEVVAPTWRMVAWGVIVFGTAAALGDDTTYWWIVLPVGVVIPLLSVGLSVLVGRERLRRGVTHPSTRMEAQQRQLMTVLESHDEVTPLVAAMRTSLTIEEAAAMLTKLGQQGYIEAKARDGVLAYGLFDRDRRSALPLAPFEARQRGQSPPQVLAEPLSEREREVLALLAAGRSNREIATDLFVAEGTIKTHTSAIYRKLGVKNRAEALARAHRLGLLAQS